MNFITLDFETASSDRSTPCEIGLTFVVNNQIVDTKSWLIKPHCYPDFNYFNIQIHGITPDKVKNAPSFPDVWDEILPLVEGQCLIAHNASFDFSVLRKTLEYYGLPFPMLDYACSYQLSKRVWEGLSSYNLKSLCFLNNIKLNHHRAGADSRATAELALIAFSKAGINHFDGIKDLLNIKIGSGERDRKRIDNIIGDHSKHKPDSIFFGKSVAFTGTLTSMGRSEALQLIADTGGIAANSVTRKLNFLVVGQQDYRYVGEDGLSSKQEKAMKLVSEGVELEIISEDDFLRNI